MMNAIEIRSLRKTYARVQVSVDVLAVPAGQMVGLFGANGSGKTTLIKIMAGLLAAETGRVHLNGYDVDEQKEQALQQAVVVLQESSSMDRLGSLRETLLPCQCEAFEPLLCGLDLWEYCDEPIANLSHGLHRRADLFFALTTDRPILLLDEPTTGLDRKAVRVLEATLKRLVSEQKRTVVVATCDLEQALRLGDRLVVLQDGCKVGDIQTDRPIGLSNRAFYQIKVGGILDEYWETWFENLKVLPEYDETTLSGFVTDQSALHGVLARIRDLGLCLLSIHRFEPDLEEILVGNKATCDPIEKSANVRV